MSQSTMFPEYKELITRLKSSNDSHFLKLFNAHNNLDNEIDKLEKDPVQGSSQSIEIEKMKKQKLALKDELYHYLQKKV